MPPLDSIVLVDHLGIKVRDGKEERQDEQATPDTHSDRGNVPCRLLIQAEIGRSLIDDGQRANGTGDKEEEW